MCVCVSVLVSECLGPIQLTHSSTPLSSGLCRLCRLGHSTTGLTVQSLIPGKTLGRMHWPQVCGGHRASARFHHFDQTRSPNPHKAPVLLPFSPRVRDPQNAVAVLRAVEASLAIRRHLARIPCWPCLVRHGPRKAALTRSCGLSHASH